MEEEEEEEEHNSPAVMQWLWYIGTCCGALPLSCPPLTWCEAKVIAAVAGLAFEGGLGGSMELLSEAFCAKVKVSESSKIKRLDGMLESRLVAIQ